MSYVKPGMLAVIIPARDGTPMVTPGLKGRFVFVERPYDPKEVFKDVNGQFVRMLHTGKSLAWVVSSRTPLPTMMRNLDKIPDGIYHFYERPIADQCLKAISGPDLGVTEDEVRELYAPKGVVGV